MGEDVKESSLSYCKPIIKNKDVAKNNHKLTVDGKLMSWDGSTVLDPEAVANPCGLIAKWVFTDSY